MTDKDSFDKRTALYHTFGCKLNFAETSTVARMLADKGIRRAAPDEKPDVIVVNTCSVTEEADLSEFFTWHRQGSAVLKTTYSVTISIWIRATSNLTFSHRIVG